MQKIALYKSLQYLSELNISWKVKKYAIGYEKKKRKIEGSY